MTAPPPLLPGQRLRARHRGLAWLAAVIALFVLVGGGYLAISSYLSSAEPGDVAVAYFNSLARGDAARALSYGPVPVGDRRYLSAEVLKAQLAAGAISAPQVISIAKTPGHPNSSTVNLSYRLTSPGGDDRTVTDVIPMIRQDRHWWLAASAVTTRVGLKQATQRATFAGTAVPDQPVLLFPGALPIRFDTPNLELSDAGSTVTFNASDNSRVDVEASPAGISAARSSVGTALAACLAASSTDVFCPTPGNGSSAVRAVPGSLRGTLAPKATDGLTVTVPNDPHGLFVVAGTVTVNGKYLALNYTNIATPMADPAISVTISADCYVTSVGAVTWTSP
jgi:hypothetical protein